ncbi:flagellar motor protein MotB [Sulfurimonas sp.]|uniref:flagellar motor protein MotB n=1 Tax=Sulfurimonas sp. TaxID=2022749 RepID=UPI0025E3F778|nr:flagellar motor protein MotB [Sulfurimonas sp.]MDD5156968.1 flagellar motor protein MotB [Sulfurimonas sp.]
MAKKKCKKCPACPPAEKWAVPTADFFSLLLALFIALFAIASVNTEKMKAVKEEFIKIYDFAPTPERATPVQQMTPEEKKLDPDAKGKNNGSSVLENGGSSDSNEKKEQKSINDSIVKIQQELKDASAGGEGSLEQSMDGVLLKLPTSVPFIGSSAAISNQDIHLFLKRIAEIIKTLPENIDISVRGYTDAQPAAGNSMELSNKRAETVAQELIKNGISAERISTAGFGSSKPIAENTTQENRAKNRRVEFYIFISKDTPLVKEKEKDILDALSKLQK